MTVHWTQTECGPYPAKTSYLYVNVYGEVAKAGPMFASEIAEVPHESPKSHLSTAQLVIGFRVKKVR